MQRFIREVNTTNRACVLWDLAEDADYIIQVQSIGLYGESQASKRVHFRTLKETDRLPSNSSNQGDITMEGLDKDRQLQTGEIIIIVAVLLMWAAVIALFCRQYDIIKDNDSNNNKEKTKPSSEHSTPERPSGGLLRSKVSAEGWQQGWHVLPAGACSLHRVWLSPGMETPRLVLSPQRLRTFRVQ
ncbi:fibronectin type III domain-containing protein 4 isoform X1 [Geospiza fortis]|uniref:Fibronectin type III domain-containing protein 4 isoform X1 n=1 Tax=Geospiza fortis TaxID=48883 RepID=A0A8N5F5H3_GEOFO|nr:fibronectin type III domain-containing protein 4 isoform X1 [Geospiza fortis]